MTNYEYMKSITIEQLGHFLCNSMDDATVKGNTSCDICPMWSKCHAEAFSGNGWFYWLKEEKK